MKNILLLIHDDPGEEARLQAALDLVRATRGHLTCLDIVNAPALVGVGIDLALIHAQAVLVAEARGREATNRDRIEARLAIEDVTWDWVDATGDFAPLLDKEARLADVIVLSTTFSDHQIPDMRSIASDVLIRASSPILAVPQRIHCLDLGGHALIAWNGGLPVAATLRAVIPILALAHSVTIVEIGRIDGPPAEDAAAYLSRHGIDAVIDRDILPRRTVGETLLATCWDRHPAYCVMGAYGHSRLRERLVGGVTWRMLADSPVPLLLGH